MSRPRRLKKTKDREERRGVKGGERGVGGGEKRVRSEHEYSWVMANGRKVVVEGRGKGESSLGSLVRERLYT